MYLWIDMLWLCTLLFVLFCTHGAAYLIGYLVRRHRTREEVQRDCKHKNIQYVDEINCYMCSDCGVIFRNRNEI